MAKTHGQMVCLGEAAQGFSETGDTAHQDVVNRTKDSIDTEMLQVEADNNSDYCISYSATD
jgi:hypothetical protein